MSNAEQQPHTESPQENQHSTNGAATSHQAAGAVSSSPVDVGFLIERTKLVLTDPKGCWDTIAADKEDIIGVYKKWILVMAAIPVVCEFLRMVTFGYSVPFVGTVKWGFFSGLFSSLVNYGVGLGGLFVSALILEKLAPKFEGNTTTVNTLKLIAYSATPAYVSGFFSLVPYLGFLGVLLSLYGLYIFWQGVSKMTAVPEASRIKYVLVSIVCMFVFWFVVGMIMAVVQPTGMATNPTITTNSSGTNRMELPGGVSVDMDKFQDSMKQLEKFSQQAGAN